jgi:hypothetical protein
VISPLTDHHDQGVTSILLDAEAPRVLTIPMIAAVPAGESSRPLHVQHDCVEMPLEAIHCNIDAAIATFRARYAQVASTSRYSASMHTVPFEARLCFA